jgi:hypothetical protein
LKLRHENSALLEGEYVALNPDDPNVLSYLRKYKDEAVLVVLNMSAEPQKATFDLSAQGFATPQPRTLLTTMKGEVNSLSQITLEPFAVYIAEISTKAAQ